eukprot:10840236-Alexandrium_andersonii.AAC.1
MPGQTSAAAGAVSVLHGRAAGPGVGVTVLHGCAGFRWQSMAVVDGGAAAARNVCGGHTTVAAA